MDKMFDMLSETIVSTQVDGKNILYFSGKFAGYNFVKAKKAENLEGLKKELESNLKELGLGSVETLEKLHNDLIIKIKNSFNANNQFINGFITGMISKLMEYDFYKFTGKEIRHDKDCCFFEVKSI
ncbi:MAG: hypothetical protein V1678_00260 [Candidatus Aenigmatarchaeota archaeon]